MFYKMLFIVFMWILNTILNFAMKKAQPETDWYFYYSMTTGLVFTAILILLI